MTWYMFTHCVSYHGIILNSCATEEVCLLSITKEYYILH